MSHQQHTPPVPIDPTPPVRIAGQVEVVGDVDLATDGLTAWERALGLIRDVVVIVTCMVFLYVVYTGYVALAELGDQLDQIRGAF